MEQAAPAASPGDAASRPHVHGDDRERGARRSARDHVPRPPVVGVRLHAAALQQEPRPLLRHHSCRAGTRICCSLQPHTTARASRHGVPLLAQAMLLPVVYTPTVGEACQKFGLLPQFPRGCYVSLSDRGRVREVLEEYAKAELAPGPAGELQCDCIVFSDGGRILGLGDLAAWGAPPSARTLWLLPPYPMSAHRRRAPRAAARRRDGHPYRQARPVHSLRGRQPAPDDPDDHRRRLLRPEGQHRRPGHPRPPALHWAEG
eukprot:2785861-Prymnesium_polylepis.1